MTGSLLKLHCLHYIAILFCGQVFKCCLPKMFKPTKVVIVIATLLGVNHQYKLDVNFVKFRKSLETEISYKVLLRRNPSLRHAHNPRRVVMPKTKIKNTKKISKAKYNPLGNGSRGCPTAAKTCP